MAPGNAPVQLHELTGVFDNFVSFALGFAAIGLFIVLLIGGFKYIVSGGEPKAAESAKKTISYGIGGMVLTACAYLILRIIAEFTGVNSITNFVIFRF